MPRRTRGRRTCTDCGCAGRCGPRWNLSQLARAVGMSRQRLNKALSCHGNPSLSTIMKVARALGLQLSFKLTH
ncbi:DNA-binding protein [Pusillimonas sp. T2]|uniref:helix-turn-helix domain-containing transcriptional regulator n=1 Tax=Pusillimonas sp. T2 TaxID=1548123 RepID=UPI00352FED8B